LPDDWRPVPGGLRHVYLRPPHLPLPRLRLGEERVQVVLVTLAARGSSPIAPMDLPRTQRSPFRHRRGLGAGSDSTQSGGLIMLKSALVWGCCRAALFCHAQSWTKPPHLPKGLNWSNAGSASQGRHPYEWRFSTLYDSSPAAPTGSTLCLEQCRHCRAALFTGPAGLWRPVRRAQRFLESRSARTPDSPAATLPVTTNPSSPRQKELTAAPTRFYS